MIANLLARAWRPLWVRRSVVILGMIFMSLVVGRIPSLFWLFLVGVIIGAVVLLQWPALMVIGIPLLALFSQFTMGTGTTVELNATVIAVPFAGVLWAMDCVRRKEMTVVPSRANRPMVLFLLSAVLSLLIGNALWDPSVPRPGNIILVQIAQWAIFALAAMAFWLGAMQLDTLPWLKTLVWCFLIAAAIAVVSRILPGGYNRVQTYFGFGVERPPFWALTVAVAGAQLLFNGELKPSVQIALTALCAGAGYYAFVLERQTSSNWVGVGAVVGVLAWLRFPKLRIVAVVLVLALLITGGLTESVYEFAGGADEWEESGGSRLALIGRVLKVTMHNPITGLGPASYRAYANTEPLKYGRAYWVNPKINSHNNYVDLFAHTGIVGLSILGWFYYELWREGWGLHEKIGDGFLGAVVASGLAIIASMGALMVFADWILPFVYNIGFSGFQSAILMWLFLGAMLAAGRVSEEISTT